MVIKFNNPGKTIQEATGASKERVNHSKPLGVWFQDDLKWSVYVGNITKKSIFSAYEGVEERDYLKRLATASILP